MPSRTLGGKGRLMCLQVVTDRHIDKEAGHLPQSRSSHGGPGQCVAVSLMCAYLKSGLMLGRQDGGGHPCAGERAGGEV
jgi:hypothetical protein